MKLVEYYMADDGEIFKNKNECEEYELNYCPQNGDIVSSNHILNISTSDGRNKKYIQKYLIIDTMINKKDNSQCKRYHIVVPVYSLIDVINIFGSIDIEEFNNHFALVNKYYCIPKGDRSKITSRIASGRHRCIKCKIINKVNNDIVCEIKKTLRSD